jgi:hypothetical protein
VEVVEMETVEEMVRVGDGRRDEKKDPEKMEPGIVRYPHCARRTTRRSASGSIRSPGGRFIKKTPAGNRRGLGLQGFRRAPWLPALVTAW